MEPIEKLADLHTEHADWQKNIETAKREIKQLNNRLAEIVSKFNPRDVPSNVEHFQNQFILQRDVLDIMRHDFKQYENLIEDEQKKGDNASESLLQMRAAYIVRWDDYDRILNDVKVEFATFEKEEVISA